ncbi:MAG: NADH-quinone oxidoreductase subunit NuoE [Rhodospirillales bacterium]|nr:NADH-quinone oxidoreductase subunit NuoE [Rhodospirillales bacterium]
MSDTQTQTAFAFTSENLTRAAAIIAKYPEDYHASAVLPLLHLAQKQNAGWLPQHVIDYVADFLKMPRIRVYEVATFYTMFNLKPVGKHHVQVCTSLPCWLRGSEAIVATCRESLGVDLGETTADGKFTLSEVECLCACVNAPIVQIGNDYFEDLDPDRLRGILAALKAGQSVKPGPQIGRKGGEPMEGLTTLTDEKAVLAPKWRKDDPRAGGA